MADVREWLTAVGLGQYADAFDENAIEYDLLPELTDEDLRDLGVAALGHRKRILKSISDLGSAAAAEASSPANTSDWRHAPSGEAERRQLTVMFCDLVGSVALGERMDVEDYRELLSRFRAAVVNAIEHSGGFVARHQGDGVLAYFGYPRASEDDAQKAVNAGLGVVEAVRHLYSANDERVEVRVGIATGPAIVGDVLSTSASEHSELAALGATPNLAARLQGQAAPDSVIISRTTHDLVAGYFAVERLPPRELKGLGETELYEVVAARTDRSRFEARTRGRLSPFLGREEELETLERRWQRTCNGRGQSVLVVGEAGIGKSRLAEHFRLELAAQSAWVQLFQCSPFLVNSALHPIVGWLERAIEAGPRASAGSLDKWLAGMGLASPESVTLLAPLLSVQLPDAAASIEGLEPNERRTRLFSLLMRLITVRADASPVLCVFEDVHWADPSTGELLAHLVEQVSGTKVMVLLTSRPGFSAAWTDLAHVHVLSLARLEGAICESLAEASAGPISLPKDLTVEIVSRAGGNPLFVEELTRSVVESRGSGATAAQVKIPATLQDSLTARLDALPEGKRVAQVASVLGRDFSYSVLSKVWERGLTALATGLEELERGALIYRYGEPSAQLYQFKHALVQDTAYGTLLRGTRQSIHAKAAEILESEQPGVDRTLLARHYAEGGQVAKAIDSWLHSGEQSSERHDNLEAVSRFQIGLSLIPELPPSGRLEPERVLQTALAHALLQTRGYAASEPRVAFERARELCRESGDEKGLPTVLQGLWRCTVSQADYSATARISREMLECAERQGDGPAIVHAHQFSGASALWSGHPRDALAHSEQAIALYDREPSDAALFWVGTNPKGNAMSVAGWALWLLGCPGQASNRIRESIAFADASNHLYSRVQVLTFASIIEVLGRNNESAARNVALALEISEEKGFAEYAWVAALRGWILATTSDPQAGLELIRTAIRRRREIGSRPYLPFLEGLEAMAWHLAGHPKEAMEKIEEALSTVGEERWIEPELLRLKGELALAQPTHKDSLQARECFERSIALARELEMKSWELRSAISMARSLRSEDCAAETAQLLGDAYQGFTEDFDTPDLVEARLLLSELT